MKSCDITSRSLITARLSESNKTKAQNAKTKTKTPKHLSTLKTITFIANYSMQNVPFKFAGDFD
jgi:hypothetical protein